MQRIPRLRLCLILGFNRAGSLMHVVMPRTRPLIVCLLVGVIQVAGLVWGIAAANQRISKRFYHGKSLEYWFNQLGNQEIMRLRSGAVRTWGSWIETPETSANAIRGIGTNALGFYLRNLRRNARSELRRLHALSVLMTSGSAVSTRSADRP